MKNHKLFIMLLLVSEMAFNYCTPQDGGSGDHSTPQIIKNDSNDHTHEYTITVSSKNWQTVNGTERFVDIPIKEITENILNEGLVMIYLIEGDKYLALPFNYYQVRRILSFQPSFEPGHAYISIYGNFIMNVSAKYEFKLLIISKDILKKNKKEKK
ncbi:MAG: hypothetical protein Q8L81_00570 [Bacteroidota bacterium]|nr:hypothetical protein [Bacteroidota bacterium]